MKIVSQVVATAVVSLAAVSLAAGQDSPQLRTQIESIKRAAGPEWAAAANFFCSTEEEIAAMKILPSATEGDVVGQRAEPMKVFDNLYFVGQKAVTTWAITTSDGIILIDSGYPERFNDTLMAGFKRLGLNPARIKLALIAHEHADHFGGARLLQERLGTKIAMSKAAWDGLEPKPGAPAVAGQDAPPKREIVMAAGQPVTLGDTSVIPVAIPGHTPGSMGFIFPVKDGGKTYMAGLFGGSILNPQRRFPAATFKEYITSIEHFAAVSRQHKVEVELLNHPIMDGLFEKLAAIRTRKPGSAHPLVIGEASYQRFLTTMADCTRVQLARKGAA
jgi:metallo-beta-lactamase class B